MHDGVGLTFGRNDARRVAHVHVQIRAQVRHGRVVVSDSGPKLAFACLQKGTWLNGAMALPRDLESAIYGWAARLAVGGLPDTELTTRLGPNGEEF